MSQLRNFEISIWTLQDDFIATIESAWAKAKGKTQNASMNLNIDGTQQLTFSVPMYYYVDGQKISNPAWITFSENKILLNTRKVKVILNKQTDDEEIYEFVIDKVTERHEHDELFCDVECSGLAFYELGKIGYKVSLSEEDFYNDDYDWFTGRIIPVEDEVISEPVEPIVPEVPPFIIGDDTSNISIENIEIEEESNTESRLLSKEQPVANIQYWLNKFLKPYSDEDFSAAQWYYKIQMDWTGYERGTERATDKIYEESYISSYHDDLSAQTYNHFEEKRRNVTAERSNIYNLTQTIAQTFGVYCKYEYDHDDNYNITGRTVIFYNNFFDE